MAKKEKGEPKPHFFKEIEYSKEPWRTDILLGQKESINHGHLALSGGTILFLRDEEGRVFIRNGSIVGKN